MRPEDRSVEMVREMLVYAQENGEPSDVDELTPLLSPDMGELARMRGMLNYLARVAHLPIPFPTETA